MKTLEKDAVCMPCYLGLDVGGTNLSAGVVDSENRVISHAGLPSGAGRSMDAILVDMVRVIEMAAKEAGLRCKDFPYIGIGVPSNINPKTGYLVHANCFVWRNVDFRGMLEKYTGCAVEIENDANCAVLGEMLAGAAKGRANVVMLTLGTGVGSGIILNGKLFCGADGTGAEFGHTKLVYNGRLCTCGQRGCLETYWLKHDLKTQYCREVLTDTTIGRFIDTEYPLIATARLSGMMLDYPKLLENGVSGLKRMIEEKRREQPENTFYPPCLDCLDIVTASADALREKALRQMEAIPKENARRRMELKRMADALKHIRTEKPGNFHEALQLFWLYALLAGVINYGRLDDFLGPYLAKDLDEGRLTEEEAYGYLKSLWTLIENRRTTVNGRVIVGGRGRLHPKEADRFLHIAMKVCKYVKYVEPQFISMRRNDEGVLSFCKAASELLSQTICLFRRDFARRKGLPKMISDHIIGGTSPSCFS